MQDIYILIDRKSKKNPEGCLPSGYKQHTDEKQLFRNRTFDFVGYPIE